MISLMNETGTYVVPSFSTGAVPSSCGAVFANVYPSLSGEQVIYIGSFEISIFLASPSQSTVNPRLSQTALSGIILTPPFSMYVLSIFFPLTVMFPFALAVTAAENASAAAIVIPISFFINNQSFHVFSPYIRRMILSGSKIFKNF